MTEQGPSAHCYDRNFTSDNNNATNNDHYGCVTTVTTAPTDI
ncbi:MAG: hypothetical protein ACYCST_02540 [Acidimicrobiales bacterium]